MGIVESVRRLFGAGKTVGASSQRVAATAATEFVDAHLADVKSLIVRSATGDLQQRLLGLCEMTGCQLVVLSRKLQSTERYEVVESSDRGLAEREQLFEWSHTQPTASASASAVVEQLPFKVGGARGFISVPVKNELNIPVGLLLGIFQESAVGLDSRTRLMHLLSPLFEPEIRCARLKAEARQQEQRVASLNQNLEVVNEELRRQKQRQGDGTEYKSLFLRNLSHEIRTPMNVVIGFADLLTQTSDDASRHKFAALIRQNSRDMLSLIDNLVELGRMETNYQVRPACAVPLNDLLRDVKKQYDSQFAKRGSSVEIAADYALPSPRDTIWNSDEIIVKVLHILLDAAEAALPQGHIGLTYAIGDEEVTFTYTDDRVEPPEERPVGDRSEVSLAARYLQLCGGRIWEEGKTDPLADANGDKPGDDAAPRRGVTIHFALPKEKK